ncbi:MAG TPA: hypothetical protein VJB87_04935 [Candidatus Nanoarchaeia archaeon]|nr:hypothetical protein [Candidatus Nanoarchaeia archaeon]
MVTLLTPQREKEIRATYERAKDVFAERFQIPKGDMPSLHFTASRRTAHYNPETNEVFLPPEPDEELGTSFGEELGHYVRERLAGNIGEKRKRELLTHEFFGFLGRDILWQHATPEERTKLFDDQFPVYTRSDEQLGLQVVRNARAMRKGHTQAAQTLHHTFLKWYKDSIMEHYARGETEQAEQLRKKFPEYARIMVGPSLKNAAALYGGEENILEVAKKREDVLTHARGYRFASTLDQTKVDLPTLFRLSDKEVRKNFFRAEPHYEVAQFQKHVDWPDVPDLEARIAAIVIGLVSVAVLGIISNHQLTGQVVANITGGQQVVAYTVILMLIGLLFHHRN